MSSQAIERQKIGKCLNVTEVVMTQDDTLIGAQFTGHPFFDVGLATMTVFVGKTDPQDLTATDLDKVATYIEEQYIRPPLRESLAMVFTAAAWFYQPTHDPDSAGLTKEQQDQRRETRTKWASRHLREWQVVPTSSTERCAITGLPAVAVALAGNLSEGRAAQAQLPFLQGNTAINFFAGGRPGIPISGLAVLGTV